ncbi:hypothetical protein BGZ65_004931 [Modicella reniformis]|uniref:Uncharacterized protein n=1 Tax=Modicella reniformis TaxID=1440133 RepID=A0A9P6IND4_9FUNG|nr:hypothetical protein BGZ65_004931 [Modicella reniformis]
MDESSPLRPVQSDTAAASGSKKRKNAAAIIPALPKPKKQKLPRNLDSITARNQLPDVPSTGGIGKTGQRMVKGPYKKREKKDKEGKGSTVAGTPGTGTMTGGTGTGAGAGAGGRKGKSTKGGAVNTSVGVTSGGDHSSSRMDTSASLGPNALHSLRDDDGEENDGRTVSQAGEGVDVHGAVEGGEGGAEGKDDDDEEHEEEPEYTEYEWNQEANSRGRSKEELKLNDDTRKKNSSVVKEYERPMVTSAACFAAECTITVFMVESVENDGEASAKAQSKRIKVPPEDMINDHTWSLKIILSITTK